VHHLATIENKGYIVFDQAELSNIVINIFRIYS